MADFWEMIKRHTTNNFSGILFFDETNNFRKLRLTESGTNSDAENKHFVLGGIGSLTKKAIDCSDLLANLKLQKTVKEFKFEHFAPKKKESMSSSEYFLNILKSQKLNTLFKWIKANDSLVIHYYTFNYIFYALTDIVDEALIELIDNPVVAYHFKLKSALYEAIKPNLSIFVKQLYDFGFPNIESKDIATFIESVLEYIEERQYENLAAEDDFITEILRQMIKAMRKSKAFAFLSGNEEHELFGAYAQLYAMKIAIFEKAHLVFDRETEIELDVERMTEGYSNYEFKDSKVEIMIQISDVVVGFVSKLLTYIESIDDDELIQDFNAMDARQKETLRLFFEIENRGDAICKILFQHIQPESIHKKMGCLAQMSTKGLK